MAKNDLRIDILGTSITISTDEEPGYLNTLLEKYRRTVENVRYISGLEDPLKTAVLTGFLLCDDLEKAGAAAEKAPQRAKGEGGEESRPAKAPENDSGEAEKITMGMISRLDEALSARPAAALFSVKESLPVYPQRADDAIFKLENTVKNYEWGSPEWIPALLGQKNLSRVPWAELWMGVNAAGPSRISGGVPRAGDAPPLLSELIAAAPEVFLGTEAAEKFKNLPFLFKVLAAVKPLSLQAHPNLEQAREGFERENSRGIPLDAPGRNYRDANHKPEIICALNDFIALCGFRAKTRITTLVGILSEKSEGPLKAGFESLMPALEEEKEPLKAFLSALFNLGPEARQALAPFVKAQEARLERDFPEYRDEWKLCSYLAGLYPGDTGILAPLYLNIIELAPGEAMYLPSGLFHSYIYGFGIELMADSDNILRGGLSSKHVDQEELLKVITFSEYRPEILKVPEPVPAWFTYPVPMEEISLSVMRGGKNESTGAAIPYGEAGPSIVIVTEGNAVIQEKNGGAEVSLKAGESAFIPAGKKDRLFFSGTFTAYVAAAGRGGIIPPGKEDPAGQIP